MRQALKLHPDSQCDAAARIEVDAARPQHGRLVLTYRVIGQISKLRLPGVTASARADELWRHTCFEAFVRASPGPAYTELNFAPSTQWAAYRFRGYREGMAVASDIEAPDIRVHATADLLTLEASLEVARLPSDAAWRLGLSAVIEEAGGRKSYWALAYPPGQADFHHADCFAWELPPSEAS